MELDLAYNAVLPEIIMFGGAVLILIVDLIRDAAAPEARISAVLCWLSLVTVALATGAAFMLQGSSIMFQTAAISDGLGFGIRLIVLATTALVLLIGPRYIPSFTHQIGEYYTLLLLCAGAMMAMGIAADLLVLFLALETFSLSLIILSGMFRENRHSMEASMKYFLLGAFASGFLVYGGALLYGAAGTASLVQMPAALEAAAADPQSRLLLWTGISLLLVGFGFKLSLVPFHMWTPDVYQGAPTTVTAFMSVGTKTAMFGALIRTFFLTLPESWAGAGSMLAALAVLTMTVGNLTALSQTSLKRMLGYSSIAHAGYVLAGLVPGTPAAVDAALFYLFAYAFMNVGAFIIIIAIEKVEETDIERSQLRGAGTRWPLLAGFMALFLFSLSGIPPLAGFFGKFLIFRAMIAEGHAWLAVIAVLNSAISAYYYLSVVVSMYFRPADQKAPALQAGPGLASGINFQRTRTPRPADPQDQGLPGVTASLHVGMAAAGVMVLAIGLFPAFWMQILTIAGS